MSSSLFFRHNDTFLNQSSRQDHTMGDPCEITFLSADILAHFTHAVHL